MKKVLVISGHPDLENSTANKAIIENLTKKMPEITIHRLDKAIKNDNFDIEKEQEQLLQYDTYVFVSPFHWFYCSTFPCSYGNCYLLYNHCRVDCVDC